jgi:hypothetical protein
MKWLHTYQVVNGKILCPIQSTDSAMFQREDGSVFTTKTHTEYNLYRWHTVRYTFLGFIQDPMYLLERQTV